MTPAEILRDLRDIHLPDQATETAGTGLVLWPALVVILLALVTAWLAWRQRFTWQREIISHLDAIEEDADLGRAQEGWMALALLLRRIAVTLDGKQEIAGLIDEAWLEKLDQLFKTDSFSSGPGRGIAVFPYGRRLETDGEIQAAGQLKATIEDLRKHVPHLRMAGPWN